VSSSLPVAGGEPEASSYRRNPPGWLRMLLSLDYVVTGIYFVVLVAITFVGVLVRYFLNDPFVWLEEVQLALFVGLVFLAGGAAFRAGSHVAIDVLVERFPARFRRVVDYGIGLVVLVVLGYYLIQGSRLVMDLADVSRSTNVLGIPAAAIYSAIPIGAALMIVNYFLTLVFRFDEEEEEVFIGA
jgi:TRAP-type C4-dicarboxylate transport system permease small subunit